MDIKMIVTDLDGTLLRDDKTVSERTWETLKKCREKGIKVVYATGRGISSKKLAPSEFFDGCIRMNGASAYLSECETKVYSRLLPINLVRDILLLADSKGVSIAAEVEGMNYSNFNVTDQWSWIHSYEIADFNTLDIEIEKIFAIADTSETVELFKSNTPNNTHLHFSRDGFAMIMHNEAYKSKAVDALAELWGIKSSEIAVFGDDSNDIDLMKYAGYSVAMSNAIDEIKEIAIYKTDTNENDGVAKWIEKNVL